MLLRFIAHNIYSFKEETEFNLFPSSRATHHLHHKRKCNHAEVLSLSAIYGANAAGKSNLIKAIIDLRTMVVMGGVVNANFQPYKFQLDKNNLQKPVSMAIEFFYDGAIYYYSVEFDNNLVSYEYLSVSDKKEDTLVFERKTNGTQRISFGKEYESSEKNKLFSSVLQDKLLNKGTLLLSFMATNYADEIPSIKKAYDWFLSKILIIRDGFQNGLTPHLLDTDHELKEYVNHLLPELKTGISNLDVSITPLDEKQMDASWANTIRSLKEKPGIPISLPSKMDTRVSASMVYENDAIVLKELKPYHLNNEGSVVDMPIFLESDGTIRLIDYLPFFFFFLKSDAVILIDEIERSLHPILIKEIVSRLSEAPDAKGQLIFTTHESCLLDQRIFRPDEIWFTEKDSNGATHLYPLSDFNIHKTADIEHGYLIGRYGGIPFLSNLKDLNW